MSALSPANRTTPSESGGTQALVGGGPAVVVRLMPELSRHGGAPSPPGSRRQQPERARADGRRSAGRLRRGSDPVAPPVGSPRPASPSRPPPSSHPRHK